MAMIVLSKRTLKDLHMPDNAAKEPIADFDRDSLFTLSLATVPLTTPSLRRARMIKNSRLESVVEIFNGPVTGSGQMEVDGLAREFDWKESPLHPDLAILRKLAAMPSFDVYSLRVLLREQGIIVNDYDALKLSARKVAELSSYMRRFTAPLIRTVYGHENIEIHTFDGLIGLFRDPDVDRAKKKLQVLAEILEIEIKDLPKFLEDYGDIFLSLSYYRQGLDYVAPMVADLQDWLADLERSWHARNDPTLTAATRLIAETLRETTTAVTDRLEAFDHASRNLWDNVSATRFREVETLIKSYHTTIGGLLCALTVKMEAWARAFPNKSVGGPVRRAKFIMADMRQGIESLRAIERAAPRAAA